MIIRKPYAFLIKYFKLIHIIMFLMYGFLIFRLQDVYNLIKGLVTGNNTTLTSEVSIFIVVFAVILLVAHLAIYYLMHEKGKPTKFYILMMSYSILIIIYYFIINGLVNDIYRGDAPNINAIVIYRDIALVVYILNYIPLVFSFVRGFGFDIRKFNFEKDLNLEAKEEDSEEVEVNLNFDKRKAITRARRELRQMSYFYDEYRKLFKIGAMVILGFLVIRIIASVLFINKVYSTNELIRFDDEFVAYLSDSYRTKYSSRNELISSDSTYIITKVHFKVGNHKYKLNSNGIRFTFDDEAYSYHDFLIGSKFSDIGTLYPDKVLSANTEYDFIFVFKVKDELLSRKGYVEIDKGRYGNFDNYFKIAVKPKEIEKKEEKSNKIGLFGGITVKDYEIANQFIEKDKVCQEDNCTEKSIVIQSNKFGRKVLKLTVDYDPSKVDQKLLNDYTTFEYKFGKKTLKIDNSVNNVLALRDGAIFYSVDSRLNEAESIKMIVESRSQKYTVDLGKVKNNGK